MKTKDRARGRGGAHATPPIARFDGSSATGPRSPVVVRLLGAVSHPDFRDAVEMLRGEAQIIAEREHPPELIIVAQARPDAICGERIRQLQRAFPLAGVVALLGSWCEGETRTGRPWAGVNRLYWYDFPAWWRRQMLLRSRDRCPDCARPVDFGFRLSRFGSDWGKPECPCPRRGVIILRTTQRETANALSEVFHQAGYASAWQRPGQVRQTIRGAAAGIWDGGQLNESEAADLGEFCSDMDRDAAPVIALLDFPRRDGIDRALAIGAACVLGKPWINGQLIEALKSLDCSSRTVDAA